MARLIKVALAVVGVLAGVLVGGGLMLPSTFTVTRSADIAAPPDEVYALVASPREWNRWAVWHQRDPGMKIDYTGPASGAGAGWSWKSASEGDGRMSFTEAEPGRRIAYELFFPDFGTTSTGALVLAPEGSGTKISWSIDGDMGGNPLARWLALAMDQLVGKDFEAGLANLKALAEKR